MLNAKGKKLYKYSTKRWRKKINKEHAFGYWHEWQK